MFPPMILDSLVTMVEQRLSANPQYAYARKLGQLSPLKPLLLDNPLKIYLANQKHTDTRLGDIKVPSLCTQPAVFGKKIGVAA